MLSSDGQSEMVADCMGRLVDGMFLRSCQQRWPSCSKFLPHALVGNTTFSFITSFLFLDRCVFPALSLKKQAKHRPQGRFVNGVEYLIAYIRDDVCKASRGSTAHSFHS